jgi:hypothetical protein
MASPLKLQAAMYKNNSLRLFGSRSDLILGALILLSVSPNAYAYIDPSAMILGLQALLATVVSGVIWIGKPIQRIKAWFKRSNKDRA